VPSRLLIISLSTANHSAKPRVLIAANAPNYFSSLSPFARPPAHSHRLDRNTSKRCVHSWRNYRAGRHSCRPSAWLAFNDLPARLAVFFIFNRTLAHPIVTTTTTALPLVYIISREKIINEVINVLPFT